MLYSMFLRIFPASKQMSGTRHNMLRPRYLGIFRCIEYSNYQRYKSRHQSPGAIKRFNSHPAKLLKIHHNQYLSDLLYCPKGT